MLTSCVKDASEEHRYAWPMETMGDRIKMLRQSKGLNQSQLADAVGVSREAVSQWENGATENIKLQPFLRLYAILGTSPEYLVYGPEAPPRGGSRLRVVPP
jgi:transcriptional regulator with XRE-family HTH domain